MQSLSTEVVQLLPPHILRYEPRAICATVEQAVDTCSMENHELLDAEARKLTFSADQDFKEYVKKHCDLRYRMQVSGYPNIETERTTVRYIVQGLAHHPEMNALAMMLACNPLTTTRELTNYIHQVQLIQSNKPAAQNQQAYQQPNARGKTTTRHR